ncbi:serine/threonine-protein kinase [Micromonospora sp. HM5-17]|uniref:serine/threonine-protein kinase n=1 Tax=Micromonospora sp. HM5-17 TaxID=2487710 RepID=UPI001F17BFF8|nr:serine/threonine-protein kinase [Micromonospora sp. HM5-17]
MVPGLSLKDRYTLGRFPLAHKGMGTVWRARDALLDRPVIVKFVSATTMDTDLVRRFRREALLTARLDHPGVPAVYDLGEYAGQPYVVFQEVNGITLSDLVAEHGPLPIGWVAAIGAQISSVLLAARQLGLVHRDIKPSNAMLEPSGAVKVLDFGLAAVPDDDRYSRITQTGQVLGTVGYMAPEQIRGEHVDHRTDLYGLGATLFDLLTGGPPFDGMTTISTVHHQITAPPPRPAERRPGIPAALDDLVHALLAPRPEDRPDTAADIYAVLAPLAQDLPPIPGVLDATAGAVQAYAAIVGRVPQQVRSGATPVAGQTELDPERTVRQAEQLQAAGQFRAAARQWRRLAEDRIRQHGDDDSLAFEFRRRAARAHLALGEHTRALRQLKALLDNRIRAEGPDAPAVRDLREEIARISGEQASPPSGRGTPGADR